MVDIALCASVESAMHLVQSSAENTQVIINNFVSGAMDKLLIVEMSEGRFVVCHARNQYNIAFQSGNNRG